MPTIGAPPGAAPVRTRPVPVTPGHVATAAVLTGGATAAVDMFARHRGVTGGDRAMLVGGATLLVGAAVAELVFGDSVDDGHRTALHAAAGGAAIAGAAAFGIGFHRGIAAPVTRALHELEGTRAAVLAHPASGDAADQVRSSVLPDLERAIVRRGYDHPDYAALGRGHAALDLLDTLAAASPATAPADTTRATADVAADVAADAAAAADDLIRW